MKIAKFQTIKNMAVFKDFHWDSCVLQNNSPASFKRTNILYGNNYSGKTTLSRIIRAFETGVLSDKYSAASFQLMLDDNTVLSEKDYPEKKMVARVFNEDFIHENLRFVIDQNSDVLPFAVLGENNAKIEEEISAIKQKLGENNPDNPTGLYKEKFGAQKKSEKADNDLSKAQKDLDKMKSTKATDKQLGIKYNVKRFNQLNYNVPFLESDIKRVKANDYASPSNDEIKVYEAALNEQRKDVAKSIQKPLFHLTYLIDKCKELCQRKIGASEKIQELIRNAALEDWVRQGIGLNSNRDCCAFCASSTVSDKKS